MKKALIATVFAMGLAAAAPAAAAVPEIGPCSDEDAIVISAQDVKICAHLTDSNECDANDVVVRVGGRTICVRVP